MHGGTIRNVHDTAASFVSAMFVQLRVCHSVCLSAVAVTARLLYWRVVVCDSTGHINSVWHKSYSNVLDLDYVGCSITMGTQRKLKTKVNGQNTVPVMTVRSRTPVFNI